MAEVLPEQMDAAEFLIWAERQPEKCELIDGKIGMMSPERVGHTRIKGRLFNRLCAAITQAALPCEAFVDGAAVRVDDRTVFEPDVLVHCGPPLPAGEMLVPDPIIVVEVLSPQTQSNDTSRKLVW